MRSVQHTIYKKGLGYMLNALIREILVQSWFFLICSREILNFVQIHLVKS